MSLLRLQRVFWLLTELNIIKLYNQAILLKENCLNILKGLLPIEIHLKEEKITEEVHKR